jgi:hypothetical protein
LLKKFFIILFFLCYVAGQSQIQKRNFRQREIGLYAGASYYIGDINPRGHFLFSQPAGGIFYRLAMSYRYAFRIGFNYGRVAASDAKSKEADQLERNLNFRSDIYDGHLLYEFNFVDYRIGNNKHYMSLFLFGGIGGYYFNPQTDLGNGYVSVASSDAGTKSYPKYQINIPFGIGYKWNISEIFGLSFEWGPRRLFTDFLDNVSGAHPIGSGNTLAGTMRGNPRTKDWYFFYGFTLNMRLPKSKSPCPAMGLGS